MRVIDPLVVHGHAEVTGGAEGFHAGIRLFQRAAHGFLTLIDTEEYLRGRSLSGSAESAISAMTCQAAQNFAFVPALVGQVQDSAPLQSVARPGFLYEGGPLRIAEPAHIGC